MRQRSAKELVALGPDIILTQNTPPTASMSQETRTIPVIIVIVADPVGSGSCRKFGAAGRQCHRFQRSISQASLCALHTSHTNTINNITGKKSTDGSVVIQFGGCDGNIPNCLPIEKGWNYMVRLYRPREEIFKGKWNFPAAQPVSQ